MTVVWIDTCINGWIDRWMNVYVHVYLNVHVYVILMYYPLLVYVYVIHVHNLFTCTFTCIIRPCIYNTCVLYTYMYMVKFISSVVFLSKVHILKALGAEIVHIPTTADFNSPGQEITIFL